MVQITEGAAKHLTRIRKERGKGDAAPRFVARESRVRLTFAPRPEPGDEVVEHGDLAVYLASDIVDSLARKVIDASEVDGKSVLILRRQRERSQPGR